MKINNFDVLKTMAERNMKIKSFPASNVTNISAGKEYGRVTILIDNETAGKLMASDPIVFSLIVADPVQFDEVKKELEDH